MPLFGQVPDSNLDFNAFSFDNTASGLQLEEIDLYSIQGSLSFPGQPATQQFPASSTGINSSNDLTNYHSINQVHDSSLHTVAGDTASNIPIYTSATGLFQLPTSAPTSNDVTIPVAQATFSTEPSASFVAQSPFLITGSTSPPTDAAGILICDYGECQKSFQTLSQWKYDVPLRHSYDHTFLTKIFYLTRMHKDRHEKPYECHIASCDRFKKGFGSKGELKRHINSKHPQSSASAEAPSEELLCPILGCPRSDQPFSRKDNRDDHLKRKHPNFRPTENGASDEGPSDSGRRDRSVRAGKRAVSQAVRLSSSIIFRKAFSISRRTFQSNHADILTLPFQITEPVRGSAQKRRRLPAGEAPTPATTYDNGEGSSGTGASASGRAPSPADDDDDDDDDGQEVQQPGFDLQAENAAPKEAEEWKQKAQDLEVRYQDLEAKYQEERTKRLDAEQDARQWRDRFGKIYDQSSSK